MADEARAMLDALMGADRNAPVEGASGVSGPSSHGSQGGAPRRQKRSCYDPDVCPLYCAWSLSSQETPTWAESMAVNEGAGGIDVYDLFTNTKSDIGPNPFKVDDHAREEFESLPDHEKRRLGYEDMLCRKLADLVRQCDRTVARNKEKLRQEVARAMKARHEGNVRGNREDLITNVNEEMLENCANYVAQATLIEEEMAELVEQLEALEAEERQLVKAEGEQAAAVATAAPFVETPKVKENKPVDTAADATTSTEEVKKTKKKKKKDKSAPEPVEEVPPPVNPTNPRIIELQRIKLNKLLTLQSLSLQLPPLRDNTDNILRQLQYLRSDTSTDKIVCEVSGNFMSSRDADERIAAHYAGKQYVGWKLVRDKLKELQKKGFGMGGGGRGGGHGGGHAQNYGHGGYGGGGGGYRNEYGRGGGGDRDRWDRDRYGGGRDYDRGYDRRDRDRRRY
eukprot:g908.t1 g908   contig10:983995-985350(+)